MRTTIVAICSLWASTALAEPVASGSPPATAETQAFGSSEPVRAALKKEMQRALALSLPELPKPYFISSSLLDSDAIRVQAELGAIVKRDRRRTRMLDVDVRVGDYNLDNSGFAGQFGARYAEVPVDADELEVRRAAWLMLDGSYKAATASYEGKRAARQTRADASDDAVPSFSKAKVESAIDEASLPLEPVASYENLARSLSKELRDFDFIQDSGIFLGAATVRRIYLNTEGTQIVEPHRQIALMVWATTQADDGMVLGHHFVRIGDVLSDLPAAEELARSVREMAKTLAALRSAPVVENYSGPVLFEGAAAAQLVERLLAQQLSGTPPPEASGGFAPPSNSFASRLGLRVLPAGFSLVDDPTRERMAGQRMYGGYSFDDEGVRGQKVELVQNGTLKALLMSRTPSKELPASNGHGRKRPWGGAEGRASNLILSSNRGVSRAALTQALLREVRREKLPYGFVVSLFEEPLTHLLAGGGRVGHAPPGGLGALVPLELYRVSPNGKKELVRGANLQGLSVEDFKDVLLASRELSVHHSATMSLPAALGAQGMGIHPLGLAVPDLLLGRVELQKPTRPHPKPPVLARPKP